MSESPVSATARQVDAGIKIGNTETTAFLMLTLMHEGKPLAATIEWNHETALKVAAEIKAAAEAIGNNERNSQHFNKSSP